MQALTFFLTLFLGLLLLVGLNAEVVSASEHMNAKRISVQCYSKDLSSGGINFEPSAQEVSRAQTVFWGRCNTPDRIVGRVSPVQTSCFTIHDEGNLIIRACGPNLAIISGPRPPTTINITCNDVRKAIMDVVAVCNVGGRISGRARIDENWKGTVEVKRRR